MRFPVARGAALAALLLGWWALPAGAHDGEAVIEVDAAHDIPPNSVHYILKVTWADDGHPAVKADVTATAVSPDGSETVQGTLTASNPDEGTYEGQLDLAPIAGDWEVTFAALDPDGTETATYTLDVEEEAIEEEPAATPEVEAAERDPESLSVSEADDDDDSPPLILLAAVFFVLGVVVAGVFWLVVNRKTEDEPADGDGGGDSGGDDGSSDDEPDGPGPSPAEAGSTASPASD